MKLKNKIIIAGLALLTLASCDVLNQEPKTAVSSDGIIKDKRSAQIALNGLYNQLQSGDYYGSNYTLLSDLSADISQSVGTWDFYRAMDTYTTNIDNLEIYDFWSQAYAAINQANFIIEKVPALEKVDQATKDEMIGQAYFIRALALFDLNRAFGGVDGVYGTLGVPVVTKPTTGISKENYPARPPINDTYAQVEADLTQAISLLNGFGTPTLVSEAAAKALMSRLYLYYKQDYSLVEQYATEVIDGYNFELVDDFKSIFVDENSAGSIFELNYTNSDGSGVRGWYFPPIKGGRGDLSLHLDFVNLLESRPNDERADLISYDTDVEVWYPTKYQKLSGQDNLQVIRLAEMYLNRAEARVKKASPDLAGALADINAVRNRANLPDTTGAGVDSAEEILNALSVERKIEFFEEGHRWFNLIRLGDAMTALSSVDRKNSGPVSLVAGHDVWPIPQQEISANKKLDQNDAYKN